MWHKSEEIADQEPAVVEDNNAQWIAGWDKRDREITNNFGENEMQFKETPMIEFDPAPLGMHVSRCIRIVDLGTTEDQMYHKDKHQVFFMWELPNEIKTYKNSEGVEISEPFSIGKFYNMSLTEGSHLRADLESWRSKPFTAQELQGFSPQKIIGAPCMLNIVHKPKKNKPGITANIVSVTPLVKGLQCPPQVHPSVYFSLDAGEFDQLIFDELSGGMKTRICASHEYQAILHPQAAEQQQTQEPQRPDEGFSAEQFDDIPF